jgi:hypothetical protein
MSFPFEFACVLLGVHGLAAGPLSAAEPSPDVMVRQWIVRAPEDKVMEAALASPDDAKLAGLLRAWVKEGSAEIVSDVSSMMKGTNRLRMTSGKQVRHTIGGDQDFDAGTIRPTHFEEVLVGASAEVDATPPIFHAHRPLVDSNWAMRFSPRDEVIVQWPVWWPRFKKPKVTSYDKTDFYVQEVTTAVTSVLGKDVLLGIMPRADDTPRWEQDAPAPTRTLDIVLGHVSLPPDARPLVEPPPKPPGAPAASNDPFATDGGSGGDPYVAKIMVAGFRVKDRDAVELLSRRTAHRDAELLEHLRLMKADGRATVGLFTALRTRSGQRATVRSARWHSYPTEMPTYPSAWQERPVGLGLEIDPVGGDANIAFDHDPVPPRRAKWPCALDNAELFMWQPQFIGHHITTAVTFNDEGVALLGAMRTPDCHHGVPGITAGETMVYLGVLQDVPKATAAGEGNSTARVGAVRGVEIDAVVFDIPAAEAQSWQETFGRVGDDDKGFAELLARADGKDVKIAAHVNLCTRSGQRGTVKNIEEVITVVEVDPPRENTPLCYRPTAMEELPTGTILEADPVIQPDERSVELNYTFTHDVAPPHEPEAREFIAKASKDENLPKATVFQEAWKGQVIVTDGRARFIGARVPPGDSLKGRLHVAFFRVHLAR